MFVYCTHTNVFFSYFTIIRKSSIVGTLGGSLFSFGATNNPYTSVQSEPLQFSIPLNIKDSAIDEHGQIEAEYLDEIFEYVSVGPSDGLVSGGNTFTTSFREQLAQAYYTDQLIDDLLEVFGKCAEDDESALQEVCQSLVDNFLTPLQNDFFNSGFDRSSLDTSIALIFGNKTTIGQVCSYARGLEGIAQQTNTVNSLPGFCCLDAPYESQIWGEKVRRSAWLQIAFRSLLHLSYPGFF